MIEPSQQKLRAIKKSAGATGFQGQIDNDDLANDLGGPGDGEVYNGKYADTASGIAHGASTSKRPSRYQFTSSLFERKSI